MISLDLLLLILAFGCFGLATFGVAARINLLALGLAFWVLTYIV